MSASQRTIFLNGEGDAWFRRNRALVEQRQQDDLLVRGLENLGISPRNVLEVGCGLGQKMQALRDAFDCSCTGIDPSKEAVAYAQNNGLDARLGTAEQLDFADDAFDLVFFGASLMYVDRSDLFRIAAEAYRVLVDPGHLAVLDFLPTWPRRVRSKHDDSLWIYSMDHTHLWQWNPAYVEVWRETVRQGSEDRSGAILLRKSSENAYPKVDRLYQK